MLFIVKSAKQKSTFSAMIHWLFLMVIQIHHPCWEINIVVIPCRLAKHLQATISFFIFNLVEVTLELDSNWNTMQKVRIHTEGKSIMCLELEKGTRIKIRSSNPSPIIPLTFKTSQICFWWKLFDVSFHKKFWGEAEDDRNSPPSWKKASIFQKLHQKVCFQKLTIKELRRQFVKSFTKENQKVVMKIEEMVDVLKKDHKFCAICIFDFNTSGYLWT